PGCPLFGGSTASIASVRIVSTHVRSRSARRSSPGASCLSASDGGVMPRILDFRPDGTRGICHEPGSDSVPRVTDAVRTPDELLEGLPDFPFSSSFRSWEGLRLAHLDEGEGPPVVVFHGQPTSSF